MLAVVLLQVLGALLCVHGNQSPPVRSRLTDSKVLSLSAPGVGSHVQVLLPFVSPLTAQISYVMSTEGGCYDWRSKTQSIISVEPIFECTNVP